MYLFCCQIRDAAGWICVFGGGGNDKSVYWGDYSTVQCGVVEHGIVRCRSRNEMALRDEILRRTLYILLFN